MGASLAFVTAAPVAEEVRRAIESEAEGLVHDWWAESMSFSDRDGTGRVKGGATLFLIGYSTADGGYREVDPDDDSLMAWREASFICSHLERWSREHGLAWELACEGEPIGRIGGGSLDPAATAFLADLLAMVGGPVLDREDRMRLIAARYADRW